MVLIDGFLTWVGPIATVRRGMAYMPKCHCQCFRFSTPAINPIATIDSPYSLDSIDIRFHHAKLHFGAL